jgi:hypothetical protein
LKFIEKIIDGFNKVMGFISDLFEPFFTFIGSIFSKLFDLLEKPLALLFWFLDGIFYFFYVLAEVAVKVIMIFVALFQFIGAIIMGLLRTIQSWLTINFSSPTNFPSASKQGFDVVMDLVSPTGIVSVIPLVLTGFLWLGFILKMIGLFGGRIVIKPMGGS